MITANKILTGGMILLLNCAGSAFANCTCYGVTYALGTPPTIYTMASEKPTCQEALSELSSKACFSKIKFHVNPDENYARSIESVEALSPANCATN